MTQLSTNIKRLYLTSSNNLCELVGNTPLIRLNRINQLYDCDIYAKCEFMNPSGSVKDRAALGLINHFETSGLLKRGYTVVEGTAGNTGIALAQVCLSKGYKCIIFMPNTQSQGKIDLLRFLGAEVHPVEVKPFDDPLNYNNLAKKYATENENCTWANQFDNLANQDQHFHTTGPEITKQLPNIDAFICATGTGGTFTGISRYLKKFNKNIECYVCDPPGSVVHSYVKSNGREKNREGSSITEGIGQGRITKNLEISIPLIKDSIQVSDDETLKITLELLKQEGLYLGTTSGINVAAAIRLSRVIGKKEKDCYLYSATKLLYIKTACLVKSGF